MISGAAIGALVGLAFAVVEYVVFGGLISRALQRGDKGPGPAIFDLVRKAQLVLFPVIGYFAGRILFGDSGAS
jgi:hypothetical protein